MHIKFFVPGTMLFGQVCHSIWCLSLLQAVGDIFHTQSAERVQDWLKNANQTGKVTQICYYKDCLLGIKIFSPFPERQILLRVLEMLTIAAGDVDEAHDKSYDATIHQHPRDGRRHSTSYSCPISLRHSSSERYDRSHFLSSGQYSRHLQQHPRPSKRKHSAKNVSGGSKGLQSALDIGMIGKQMFPTKTVK